MKNLYRRASIVLLGSVIIIGCGLPTIVFAKQAKALRTKPATKTPREVMAERHFPNVVLTTHEGKKVRFYDDLIKDKIVVFNFMYAECDGICPGTTANLLLVQKMLGDRVGKDIFMYSITLKPEHDTPQVLKEYAEAYEVKPGWLFLTGDAKDIESLRRTLGFIDLDPLRDADKSNHIGMIRYGNEKMQWWAGCPGMLNPRGIVKSISLVDWPKTDEARRGEQK